MDDTRQSRQFPVRELLPNERLQVTLMGVGVQRTDIAQATAGSSGQFTAEDREMLREIYRQVTGK
jgi:hypothetical protein